VLSVTLGATAATLAAGPEVRVATAFTIIAVSTFAAGLLMWLTGRFRAGLIVKFFPLEVLAGFMAGTGWLLLTGGFAMTAGIEPGSSLLAAVTDAGHLSRALPALAFGVVLYLGMARFSHPATLLGLLLGGVAVFYVWLYASGGSVAEATAAGYLPRIDADAALALPFPAMLGNTDWSVVALALPGVLTAALLCLFAALLNTSALEMAAGRETDIDREMRLTGGSNLLVACVGGPPGYPGLAISVLAQKLGVRRRGLGLVTAAVVLAGFLFSREIVAHVPVFVNAGLIIYFGIDLLQDWLINTYRRFSLREWSVVVLIVLVVAVSGFLQAIGAGFLVATVLFAWSYAHVPVIRNTATLATLPSSIERPPQDAAFIVAQGGATKIIQLQGFLFFGTAERLMAPLREAMAQRGNGTDTVVLDLTHVTSLDSASAAAILRLVAAASKAQLALILCGTSAGVRQSLERAGLAPGAARQFDTLDQALEHVERQILSGRESHADAGSPLAARHAAAVGEDIFARLVARLRADEIRAGDPIISSGEWADHLFFLEQGRAVVMLPRQDGGRRRLRTMEAGALLGDVAFALDLPRTADVLAEEDCRVLSISAAEIRAMEQEDPVLGIALQRIISRALAEKVVAANRLTDHMRS
jgi:SulP family sulfate permease